MAHFVKEPIQLHQSLHGYSDGHRVLAISTDLKPRDVRTMLVLSDASGPGGALPVDGYVTGYPLSDSGFYALARTWPAPEKSRPGCVWTHTLLIEFSDLASLPDLGMLFGSFRRPGTESSVESYSSPTQLLPTRCSLDLALLDSDVLNRLVRALYGTPHAKIVASASQSSLALTSRIWGRQ